MKYKTIHSNLITKNESQTSSKTFSDEKRFSCLLADKKILQAEIEKNKVQFIFIKIKMCQRLVLYFVFYIYKVEPKKNRLQCENETPL